jgi:hypothetical protein
MPYLQAAAMSDVEALASKAPPPGQQCPEWDDARREVCESPLQLRLFKAIRSAGLPEPMKQHEVHDGRGRLVTRPDFAYTTPHRILIYVWHGQAELVLSFINKSTLV